MSVGKLVPLGILTTKPTLLSVSESGGSSLKGLFENIEAQQKKIDLLNDENNALSKSVLSWADKPIINALVRRYGNKAKHNNFGEAWVEWKKELLYKHGININSRITNYLNDTGKKTKPKTLDMLYDKEELTKGLQTIIAMCRDNQVSIDDILEKHKNENEQ